MKKTTKIMLLSGAATLCLGLGVSANASISTAATPQTVDMYLIAGQSNAVGFSYRGEITGSFDNVWYAGEVNHHRLTGKSAYSWLDVEDIKKSVTTGYGSQRNAIGPEFGMAAILNDLYTDDSAKALIFKSAEGGTRLTHDEQDGSLLAYGNWCSPTYWEDGYVPTYDENGYSSDGKGALYQLFVNNFQKVYNGLIEEGYIVNVKGLAWMQGESDINYITEYEAYLEAFITDMRQSLSIVTGEDLSYMPVVIGKIAPTFQAVYHPDNGYVHPNGVAFNEMQQRVADKLDCVSTVSSADLLLVDSEGRTLGTDISHFNGEDMLELGKRFGNELVDMNSIALDDFTMLGASVRVKRDVEDATGDGIRFAVGIQKDVWQTMSKSELENIHVLVMPKPLVDGALEVGESKTVGGVTATAIDAQPVGSWGQYTLRGVDYMYIWVYVYGIPTAYYDLPLCARGYYMEDGSPVYTKTITRSFAYVAQAAIQDDTWEGDKLALEDYLPTYSVTFKDENGEVIESATQSVKYGEKAVCPTDLIHVQGYDVARWLLDGEIWHFERPVTQNLVLSPDLEIGKENDEYTVVSGSFDLSADGKTLETVRMGKIIFDGEEIPALGNKSAISYSITFSMQTPLTDCLVGAPDGTDQSIKGFLFGYDQTNDSYWVFDLRYRNLRNNGGQEGWYPYIRKYKGTGNGFETEVRGSGGALTMEAQKWYDFKIDVTQTATSTALKVEYKTPTQSSWDTLISTYTFSYVASGNLVGFQTMDQMDCGAKVEIKRPDEAGYTWDGSNWSEVLSGKPYKVVNASGSKVELLDTGIKITHPTSTTTNKTSVAYLKKLPNVNDYSVEVDVKVAVGTINLQTQQGLRIGHTDASGSGSALQVVLCGDRVSMYDNGWKNAKWVDNAAASNIATKIANGQSVRLKVTVKDRLVSIYVDDILMYSAEYSAAMPTGQYVYYYTEGSNALNGVVSEFSAITITDNSSN